MPLILAIEPDRRQAAQLTGLVRRHTSAELIIAGTTEAALGVIGQRVPDLVLVPALLSPQDDAALAAALRAAAADVQTLTIPVLGVPQPKTSLHRVPSMLRGGQPRASSPDGCDPTVFAGQIVSYLERLAEERAAASDAAHDDEDEATVEALTIEAPPQDVLPVSTTAAVATGLEEALSALVERLDAESPAGDEEAGVLEPTRVTPRPRPSAGRGGAEWSTLIESLRHDLDRLDAERHRQTETAAAADVDESAHSSQGPAATAEFRIRDPLRRSTRPPIQDEWGLFDPEQCGFAALLARLDEITEERDAVAKRRA